jgi:hypothetical protein
MKLVLVHGRSQEDKSEEIIRADWTAALEKGYAQRGQSAPANVDIRVPFYGKQLDDLSKEIKDRVERVVERGEADPAGVDEFQVAVLMALKQEAGISDAEVLAEMPAGVVERGLKNMEWVHAVGRAISRRVPWLAPAVITRFLADVDAYLNFPDVNAQINDIVRADIEGSEPCVVVGHSLGSVVTYWVLSNLGPAVKAPLYVTVGSPLAIDVIKRKLPRPLGIPGGVTSWFNAADEGDVVALFSRLDASTFVGGIENHNEVHNPEGNEHGISGYLSDQLVNTKIYDALVTT